MSLGCAQALVVALVVWTAMSSSASARAPKSAAPAPQGGEAAATEHDAEAAAAEIDPEAVSVAEGEASAEDAAHLREDHAEAAPTIADVVLAIPQVQTMVHLFGRGLTVNDDTEEPPSAPVSVRVRTRRAGAALSFSVRF